MENAAKKRGHGHGKVVQPFAGLKPHAFESAVGKMTEFLQNHEGMADVSAWHLKLRWCWSRTAFKTQLTWLEPVHPSSPSLWKARRERLCWRHQLKMNSRHSLLKSQHANFTTFWVAIPALQLEEKLPSAQLESSLPSQRLLQIAVANLKLHTRKESLKSVASGLRLRHAFASTVLGYAEDRSLLPHVEGDMCRFIAIFQNPGTATNYVGYIKWACQGFALLLAWHGSDLKMTLQGLKKQYQSARAGVLPRKRLMSEDLLQRHVQPGWRSLAAKLASSPSGSK